MMCNRNTKAVILALLLAGLIPAQTPQAQDFSAGTYFGLGPEQQRITVERYFKANKAIRDECVPDMDVDAFLAYFNDWLVDHPGYYSRPVHNAFIRAVIHACQESESE